MVQKNMKVKLLAVFAFVFLSSMLVPEAKARSTSTFARPNEDPDADEVAGPEENMFFDSPDLASPSVPGTNFQTKKSSSEEIMRTAETYFRPLSRYRELQKEKEEKQRKKQKYDTDNEVAAAAKVPITRVPNRVHDRTLLSKKPEYCLPVNNGIVCFYKI